MKTLLKAGAGRAAISIPENFFPYRAFLDRYFTEQHENIYARALLLQTAEETSLFVAIELGDLVDVDEWINAIEKKYGLPEKNIFFAVTHNHMAPHPGRSIGHKITDEQKSLDFRSYVWTSILSAVDQAYAGLRPATVGFGEGKCDININRDYVDRPKTLIGNNPHGLSDKTVAVLKFDDLNGEPIAVLANYAVHGAVMMGVTFKDGGLAVSGDLPGFTSSMVEKAYDDKIVALWTSGAAADQNPRFMGNFEIMNTKMTREDVEAFMKDHDSPYIRENLGMSAYVLAKYQAEALADEILYTMWLIDNDKETAEITCAQRSYLVPGQQRCNPFAKDEPDFRFVEDDANPTPIRVSIMKINDIILVGVSAEVICSVGLMLKAALVEKSSKIIVVTHCNGSAGYTSDTVGYVRRSREAMSTRVARGWAERQILDAAMELLKEIEQEEQKGRSAQQ